MDVKKVRAEAFKAAVLMNRRRNDERRLNHYRVAPFVLSTFMAGIDYMIEIIREDQAKKP